jgi:hypothetical protein
MSNVCCVFCKNWFRPARRRGSQQKACYRIKCRRKRESMARRGWRRKNRRYFQDRYPSLKMRWDYAGYLRDYREGHPEYVAADNLKRRARRGRARRQSAQSADIQHAVPRR